MPISPAVASAPARILLITALIGMMIASAAMIMMHVAKHRVAIRRASWVAGGAALICAAAFGLALVVGSSA